MGQLTDRMFCITVGSLLHDIGKVLQRANGGDTGRLQTEGARSMMRGNLVGYQHALWTAEFLFRWEKELRNLSPVQRYGFEKFQKLASKHHKPDGDSVDEQTIQAADWASAGADRHREDPEVEPMSGGVKKYIRKPLVSQFTRMRIDGTEPQPAYHGLGSLNSECVFPVPEVELSEEEYTSLMVLFEKHFKRLPFNAPQLFIDALAALIAKFFWCVPSSTLEEYADIPLSDHSITTAAIAAAIAASVSETGNAPRETGLLLVSGDFAGIQKFIFTLTGESNRGIAKLLRGRSFMVNMYTILATRLITDRCGLPPLNALSVAGGRFRILLPATPGCAKELTTARRKIEEWVLNRYGGELRLVIDDGAPFEYGDFQLKRFQEVLAQAEERLLREKLRPFNVQLAEPEGWTADLQYNDFRQNGKCRICGIEPAAAGGETGTNCKHFIDIGQQLPNGTAVTVGEGDADAVFGTYSVTIHRNLPDAAAATHACFLINLHKKTAVETVETQFAELHYANYTPRVEVQAGDDGGETDLLVNKTFEAIAGEGQGLAALAVLKADLDNMGHLFSAGFIDKNGTSTLSISRMVSLSRMVNWFFAGYLPSFISSSGGKYENIYTLFAGGDDLCLIGRWDTMISLAAELQSEFCRYVGHSPAFTLSAGLELFKPRYPVVKAVADAEQMLERSKANQGKNSISVFGYTMKWKEEFESQVSFAEHWSCFSKETATEEAGTHSAMLYRFLSYHREWENALKQGNNLVLLKHRFRFLYDINRNLSVKSGYRKDWRMEKPFVDLLVTQTPKMEETSVFKFMPVGISVALYKIREKEF